MKKPFSSDTDKVLENGFVKVKKKRYDYLLWCEAKVDGIRKSQRIYGDRKRREEKKKKENKHLTI